MMETKVVPNNRSGLLPVGKAVLLKMYEPDRKEGSLIEIPDLVREKSGMMEQRALVIAVGEECWSDEKAPRALPGDRVIITKLAGYVARGPADGQLYRLVNANDVFCKITEEREDVL